MNKKIIRNARIITMNERLDILPNGNILIENGKISAITTQSSSYDYAKGLCR